jgi:hypothetical protein
MSETVVLDDDFTLAEIRSVADDWPELAWSGGGRREARQRIAETVQRSMDLFDRHRGFTYLAASPGTYSVEQKLLRRGLSIIGLTLHLEEALPLFERVVEVDWRAHLDLDKEKRYRDHITHPVRVTGIGWWLLHRDDKLLLDSMAEHYAEATREYRAAHGIDTTDHTWAALVEYAWLAAGLLHDSAYPLEYHLKTGERLGHPSCDALGMLASGPRFSRKRSRNHHLGPLAASWLEAQGLNLDSRLADLPKRGFKHAHALLGALHHVRALGDKLHTLQGLIVQMAARAIVTHHDKDEASIVSDPLALLLYVADNLQAWRRPFLLAQTMPDRPGVHAVRPIIECDRIELIPDGDLYRARFVMNPEAADMAILKNEPYRWNLAAFREPNLRLQELIGRHPQFPRLILAEPECVQPEEFRTFMETLMP